MRQRTMLLAALALTACDAGPSLDDAGDVRVDGGREVRDATVRDAGGDGGVLDAFVPIDAGRDSGADSGRDAGRRDSGADAGCTGACCDDLVGGSDCPSGYTCRYQFDGGSRTGRACETTGIHREGAACEINGTGDTCMVGHYCDGISCWRYCVDDTDCPDSAGSPRRCSGQRCVADLG
ncbi:MAG: hypothetical protein RLO52_34540 [Sandaracinaceae bacterium]